MYTFSFRKKRRAAVMDHDEENKIRNRDGPIVYVNKFITIYRILCNIFTFHTSTLAIIEDAITIRLIMIIMWKTVRLQISLLGNGYAFNFLENIAYFTWGYHVGYQKRIN